MKFPFLFAVSVSVCASLLAVAREDPPCVMDSSIKTLEDLIASLGEVTVGRCVIYHYETLTDDFKKLVSLELQLKSQGGITFGDDFIWGPEPKGATARVLYSESFRRLYSNSSCDQMPHGVRRWLYSDFVDDCKSPKSQHGAIKPRKEQGRCTCWKEDKKSRDN